MLRQSVLQPRKTAARSEAAARADNRSLSPLLRFLFHSDMFKPIHPAGTLASKLPASSLVGTVDTATGYQLLAGNNEGEVTEEDREERRLALPPVEKVINLNEFEEMARRVLGEDSKAYKFYASVAEDGVGKFILSSSFSMRLL